MLDKVMVVHSIGITLIFIFRRANSGFSLIYQEEIGNKIAKEEKDY